ncbi:LysR family transcriptional regulator [Crystallibacter crystallopoietes]|uniref:LysR family transcriptional regulator n=1 Tax=Crystallibacter crystallopoietes TaxID=37928 RepID=UPI00167F5DCB|nr:LysR family transcriptional regulator [Arthrobacter crystallopoietes]
MNLRQLEYFLTVVAEGSFSRAAAALHMTQPPLSQSVIQLEKQLGVQLLHRHPQGVSTTLPGSCLQARDVSCCAGASGSRSRSGCWARAWQAGCISLPYRHSPGRTCRRC